MAPPFIPPFVQAKLAAVPELLPEKSLKTTVVQAKLTAVPELLPE